MRQQKLVDVSIDADIFINVVDVVYDVCNIVIFIVIAVINQNNLIQLLRRLLAKGRKFLNAG